MRKLAFLAAIGAAIWYAVSRRQQPQADTWPQSTPAEPATDADKLKAEAKLNPDDRTLVDRVESEIFRDRKQVKGKVNINVEEGVVVLRGELESQDLIDDLVKAVHEVDGVRNVENLLHTPGAEAPAKS